MLSAHMITQIIKSGVSADTPNVDEILPGERVCGRFVFLTGFHAFLAKLSRRLIGSAYSIPMVRRPSVIVHIFEL